MQSIFREKIFYLLCDDICWTNNVKLFEMFEVSRLQFDWNINFINKLIWNIFLMDVCYSHCRQSIEVASWNSTYSKYIAYHFYASNETVCIIHSTFYNLCKYKKVLLTPQPYLFWNVKPVMKFLSPVKPLD